MKSWFYERFSFLQLKGRIRRNFVKEEDKAEEEEELYRKAWNRRQRVKYRDYFAQPRLRKDWYEASAGLMSKDAGSTSQEHYWNALFAFALCNAGNLLVVERYGSAVLVFESFFRCWEASGLYATRFNDDDLWHRLWWGAFGLGVLFMLGSCMVSLADPDSYYWVFAFSTSYSHIILALANLRVAIYLKECRHFSFWAFGQHAIHSTLYILLGFYRSWLLFTTAAFFGICANCFSLFLPQSFHLPLSVEYHEDKYKGFSLMVLSQFVALMAMAIQPRVAAGDIDWSFFVVTVAGLIFILYYKVVLLDSRIVPIHLHALNCHRKWMRLSWLILQRFVTFAVILAGAGFQLIVTSSGNNKIIIQSEFDRALHLATFGSTFLLILVPIIRDLDLVRPRRPRAPCLLAALAIASIPALSLPPVISTSLFPIIVALLKYVETRRTRIDKSLRIGVLTRDMSSIEASVMEGGYGTNGDQTNSLDIPATLPEPQLLLDFAEKMNSASSTSSAQAKKPKKQNDNEEHILPSFLPNQSDILHFSDDHAAITAEQNKDASSQQVQNYEDQNASSAAFSIPNDILNFSSPHDNDTNDKNVPLSPPPSTTATDEQQQNDEKLVQEKDDDEKATSSPTST